MATLVSLISFDVADGAEPQADLLIEPNGDLFGTTDNGGANSDGTVFEIAVDGSSPTGYASTPETLLSFDVTNGANPYGSLIDINGNLFGTTHTGDPAYGSVFELVDNGGVYTQQILAGFGNFSSDGANPTGSLIADSNGDLFGTAIDGGEFGEGTVFELGVDSDSPTGTGYALAPTPLFVFDGTDGANPEGSLITDGNGDFFGTTSADGANGYGTVFELVGNGGGYTLNTLVSFNATDGGTPQGSLIADANGDLFGTTLGGGAHSNGTVFELVNNGGGAYTLNTLISFDYSDGAYPSGSLIMDAAGNLFGTTKDGGTSGDGTVFELVNDGGGAYALNTLVNFTGVSGANPGQEPDGSLTVDAAGDLFGTTFIGGADNEGTAFEITDSGYQAPCYCRGTLILTERGEVAVEDLRIGDLVMTFEGVAKPIKWIGRRSYDGRFIRGNRDVLPIRIAAGAIVKGVPARDLWVSPGHALYLDGVLVPAERLINGLTITRAEAVERVDYFHLEFEGHEIIVAEGASAESYVESDNRRGFQNFAEFAELYPDDDRPSFCECAPRLEPEMPALTPIRQKLFERAAAFGHAITDDPDLHLVVDGAVVRPSSVGDDVYCFTLDRNPGEVQLSSRSAIPAELELLSTDTRRLGVCITGIVLRDAHLRVAVAHGHSALCEGFHEDEGERRWTNGLGLLPEALLRPFHAGLTIEVKRLPARLRYSANPIPGPEISAGRLNARTIDRPAATG
jgi:uncharacterized repeat protein (TIGR03803 family)